MSWYTVEADRNDTIYFRINGTKYAPSKWTILEGSYSTTTLAVALCKSMNDHYPIAPPTGTPQQDLFHKLTWPITLALYLMPMAHSKYCEMSKLLL